MIKKIDLGFCDLIVSPDDSDINYEKQLIMDSYKLNKKFMGIKIPKFNVKIVYSRKELNDEWGSKTSDYVSAFAKEDSIVIFSYGVFDKESKWPKEKFEEALIHEINHLFYQELRYDEYDPLWLSEGLATFIQHKKKKSEYKEKRIIGKKTLTQSFEKMTEDSYQIFTLFVEFLILHYGKEKLFSFIKELRGGTNLDDSFKKVYNKSFEGLIEDANRYQETA